MCLNCKGNLIATIAKQYFTFKIINIFTHTKTSMIEKFVLLINYNVSFIMCKVLICLIGCNIELFVSCDILSTSETTKNILNQEMHKIIIRKN